MRCAEPWAAAAVAGGLVAVGSSEDAPDELFDEGTGRWFELPHAMAAGGSDRGTGLADLEALGRTADHDVAGLGVGEDKTHLLQAGQVPDVGRQGLAGGEATGDFLLETR